MVINEMSALWNLIIHTTSLAEACCNSVRNQKTQVLVVSQSTKQVAYVWYLSFPVCATHRAAESKLEAVPSYCWAESDSNLEQPSSQCAQHRDIFTPKLVTAL